MGCSLSHKIVLDASKGYKFNLDRERARFFFTSNESGLSGRFEISLVSIKEYW